MKVAQSSSRQRIQLFRKVPFFGEIKDGIPEGKIEFVQLYLQTNREEFVSKTEVVRVSKICFGQFKTNQVI